MSNPMNFAIPQTAAHQASLSFTISWSLLKLVHWVGDVIYLILCCSFLLLSSIFPSIRVFFLLSWLFASGDPSIGALASASVLPMNIQGWFPLGLTGLISLLSKDSQEFSLAPQFESITSLVFSFLYGPTLTSVPDYWKSNSFDYMDLYWQNGVSALSYAEVLEKL